MGLRDIVVKWLGIQPIDNVMDIEVKENTTREINTLKNQIWYRGDPVELEQFHEQLAGVTVTSNIPSTRFWASSPLYGHLIRKLHSGIPRLIADKLAGIVVDDMMDPEMDGDVLTRWQDISEDIDFEEVLSDAIVGALSEGDGAFKICVDSEISKYPLIEFYKGNDVDFFYKRGKLQRIEFYTEYKDEKDRKFKLVEDYGKGYVNYTLYNHAGKEVDMKTLPETETLENITFDGDYIMGVPLKIYKSSKWRHRGESIFEGKGDAFDSLDECMSTWMDSVRAGRVKQYIPDSLVPRDVDTGELRKPDVFNTFLVKNTDLSEDADNKIDVVQGKIEYDGLLNSYITFLDCSLQGLISPSTLGIDVKKLDNAESQREKEKTTLYTRDTIISSLGKVLPKLVEATLKTEDTMHKRKPAEKYESTFEWGQYANPSFEAMVDTIGKARTNGVMSIERCVDELYGDTMDEKEKKEEVARLKSEGAMEVEEPSLNDDSFIDDGGEDDGAQL